MFDRSGLLWATIWFRAFAPGVQELDALCELAHRNVPKQQDAAEVEDTMQPLATR
jgi:hypothetical protein